VWSGGGGGGDDGGVSGGAACGRGMFALLDLTFVEFLAIWIYLKNLKDVLQNLGRLLSLRHPEIGGRCQRCAARGRLDVLIFGQMYQ
jgi:hypothetical protein